MDITSVVIIHSSNKEQILRSVSQIDKKLKNLGIRVHHLYDEYHAIEDGKLMDETIDLAIAVGGDGTALKASRICAERKIPIFPINQGNFGFINEIQFDEWEEAFSEFLNGDYNIGEYHLFEAKIGDMSWLAFNDVAIHSQGYGTIAVSLYRNTQLITKYRADGVIIATPTGSTGHSLSAGGPIVVPGINACIVNPIAPFSLSNRPIILPIDYPLDIEIEASRHESVLVVDGRIELGLLNKCHLQVLDSKFKAKIVHSKQRTYFEILRNKLGWAGEFRA